MNTVLKDYLVGLVEKTGSNSGYAYALAKARRMVSQARSPLNPRAVRVLKGFGDQVARRVCGHFAGQSDEDFFGVVPDDGKADLSEQVGTALQSAIDTGHLGDLLLSRALKNQMSRMISSLEVFVALRDIRDLELLRDSSAEVLTVLRVMFPPKRAKPGAIARGKRAPKMRPKLHAAGEDQRLHDNGAANQGAPRKSARACKPFSGGWAIMVALHNAGEALNKKELAEVCARDGLCREPLLKTARTVSHGSQWYSPWSSHVRLCNAGWLVKVGNKKYALTEAGNAEAARYAAVHRGNESQSKVNSKPTFMMRQRRRWSSNVLAPTDNAATLMREVCGTSIEKEQDGLVATRDRTHGHLANPTVFPSLCLSRKHCEAIDLSDSDVETSKIAQQVFRVLMDINEKPDTRECILRKLPTTQELRLPGVDYAFGRGTASNDFEVASVFVERKTVHDYLDTLLSERGSLQAAIHETLIAAGFRVVVILEGTNELQKHPQQDEILSAIYDSQVDVLTTASLHDTVELLGSLAVSARSSGGWTLAAVASLVAPHYEPTSSAICRAALISLNVAKPFAGKVADHFGFSALVQKALVADNPVMTEAVIGEIATTSDLTLFQAGKVLQALGVDHARLSRKKRPRSCTSTDMLEPQETPAEVFSPQTMHVEVGASSCSAFRRALRNFLAAEDVEIHRLPELAAGTVRIVRGMSQLLTFRLGDGLSCQPGAHWLVVPGADAHWKEVTANRGRVYMQSGVISSFCSSADQGARHVHAAVSSLTNRNHAGAWNRQALRTGKGVAAVLSLARTSGGSLPQRVAERLAKQLGTESVVQIARALMKEGDAILGSVHDLGPERLRAVKVLVLGHAASSVFNQQSLESCRSVAG